MIATAAIVGAAIAIAANGAVEGTIAAAAAMVGADKLKIAGRGPKAAAASVVRIVGAIIAAMTGAATDGVTIAAAITVVTIIAGTTADMITVAITVATTVGATTVATITAGIIAVTIDGIVADMAVMGDIAPPATMVTARDHGMVTDTSAHCTISSTTIPVTIPSDGLSSASVMSCSSPAILAIARSCPKAAGADATRKLRSFAMTLTATRISSQEAAGPIGITDLSGKIDSEMRPFFGAHFLFLNRPRETR